MRRVANVAWWLGLSVYFGGMLTVGVIVAPSVFHTVRQTGATLPGMPERLDAHSQLGGEIFGDVLDRSGVLEWVAIGFMLVGLAARLNLRGWFGRLTLGLVVLIGAIKLNEQLVVFPAVWRTRAALRAATMPLGQFAKDFAVYHSMATLLGQTKLVILLVLVLMSAWTSVDLRSTAKREGGETHG